ncbi:MAG: hypothetical protein JRJ77_09790 [Deltaproteobacteria bacterium]|nr:hypothetical protein [Deltaproteobacteria bacterium]
MKKIRQTVRAHNISHSIVLQLGGETVDIHMITPSTPASPIYFACADSDVQLFIHGVGQRLTEKQYAEAMERGFRLLLAFKPFDTYLVIAPSSYLQSPLTYNLIQAYRCFLDCQDPHVYALRRETDWKEYVEKRQEKTKNLAEHPRYSMYYESNVIHKLTWLPALSKRIYSGISCGKLWLQYVQKAHGGALETIGPIRLLDIVDDLSSRSIIVWEAIQARLMPLGESLAKATSELRSMLVRSYLEVNTLGMDVPDGIGLQTEFPGYRPRSWYSNVRLLEAILRISDSFEPFMSLSPKDLRRLLQVPAFLEFKFHLDVASSVNEILLVSAKNADLMAQALRQARFSG